MKAILRVFAACAIAAVPATQAVSQGAPGGGLQDADHVWTPQVYTPQGVGAPGAGSSTPVARYDPCAGGACAVPQVQQQQPQGRWTYHPVFQAALAYGVYSNWMMRACSQVGTNATLDDSQCAGPAPADSCVLDSQGAGCCSPTDFVGTTLTQNTYMRSRVVGNMMWNCN